MDIQIYCDECGRELEAHASKGNGRYSQIIEIAAKPCESCKEDYKQEVHDELYDEVIDEVRTEIWPKVREEIINEATLVEDN